MPTTRTTNLSVETPQSSDGDQREKGDVDGSKDPHAIVNGLVCLVQLWGDTLSSQGVRAWRRGLGEKTQHPRDPRHQDPTAKRRTSCWWTFH